MEAKVVVVLKWIDVQTDLLKVSDLLKRRPDRFGSKNYKTISARSQDADLPSTYMKFVSMVSPSSSKDVALIRSQSS